MGGHTTQREHKFIEEKEKAGWTSQEIADALGFSISTIRKWRQRLKKMVQLNLS